MSGRRTSGRAGKSANFALFTGSGCSVDDGRPVLRGGPDVRKNAGRPMGQGQRKISDPGNLGSKSLRFRGWKVGKLGEMLDPLETNKSMDQNQQNFIKPTNHKKIGAIFGGDFQN